MRKALLTLALFSAVTLHALAQGQLKLEEKTHDFGYVTQGDLAEHEFAITNTGNKPVIISNVQASCGCTTPAWTKEPILPGKTGIVKASYNSAGRPGPFTKTITITSNATNPSEMVYIKGLVSDKKPETYTPEQLAASPVATLSRSEFKLGKVVINTQQNAKLEISNNGPGELKIEAIKSACNCVVATVPVEALKKGQKVTVNLAWSPFAKGDASEAVYILTNDLKHPATKVKLSANVVENLASPNMMKEGDAGNGLFK